MNTQLEIPGIKRYKVNPESFRLFELLANEREVKPYLAELRKYFPDVYEHELRTCLLCLDICDSNGISSMNLLLLGLGGLLHDIGKEDIPQHILRKEGPLSEEEKEIMRSHARLGYLRLQGFVYKEVANLVIAHHEFEENPYPRSGKDRRQKQRDTAERRSKQLTADIAPIVSVSDIVDALASQRPYKEPLTKEQIIEILSKQFKGDPKYIKQAFEKLFY